MTPPGAALLLLLLSLRLLIGKRVLNSYLLLLPTQPTVEVCGIFFYRGGRKKMAF